MGGRMEAAPGAATSTPYARLSATRMVIENRPWRLVADLSKVLVAAIATAGFFITNSSSWAISDQLGGWRLSLVALSAFAGLLGWIVIAHSLWERPSATADPAVTKRVNRATVVTLALGLSLGYFVLFLLVLGATWLAIPHSFVVQNLEHGAGTEDYIAAAWYATSLATVAGALGSGLESDEDVRETVSRYRPRPGNDG
jgi:Mn2+/Fe2+ NRAMP family transporter